MSNSDPAGWKTARNLVSSFSETASKLWPPVVRFLANAPNSISAVAPPQTLQGELTALLQNPYLEFKEPIFLRGGEERGEERNGGEEWEGKRERDRRGKEGRVPPKQKTCLRHCLMDD